MAGWLVNSSQHCVGCVCRVQSTSAGPHLHVEVLRLVRAQAGGGGMTSRRLDYETHLYAGYGRLMSLLAGLDTPDFAQLDEQCREPRVQGCAACSRHGHLPSEC